MRAVDVNVLVFAHRPEAPNHQDYFNWLENARQDLEPLAVSSVVLSGFIRVVTHPRLFVDPSPLEVALSFVTALRASSNVLLIEPGPRHWQVFVELCRSIDARGNDIPDVFLAALAVEHGATWYSADRGFARFPRLRWRHPLQEGRS